MSLELGYGIAGLFCIATCVIVAVSAMNTSGLVSREPVAMAALAGAFLAASWLNWYPAHTEALMYVAIAISALATWAARKDASAVVAAMRPRKNPA